MCMKSTVNMDLNLFLNLITAVSSFITVCTIIFAVWQLRFTAWLEAQKIFTDKDFTAARGVVLAHYWQSDKEWANDDKEKVKLVCAKMDELARLIPFISEKRVLETWDDPMGKCWHVLEDFVIKERKTTKWDVKWKAFEDVGRKAFDRVKEREQQNTEIEIL